MAHLLTLLDRFILNMLCLHFPWVSFLIVYLDSNEG
jgi:hypothetical protein